jgi:DNA-binding transcriptional MerR regulator
MKKQPKPVQLPTALQDKVLKFTRERERLYEELRDILAAMRDLGTSYREAAELLDLERLTLANHPPKRIAHKPELWRDELQPVQPKRKRAHNTN